MVNPRYLAYCRAHGRTPAAMMSQDEEVWSGGRMAGFVLWISARWGEWDRARGNPRDHIRSGEEHEAFDQWLESRCTRET